MYHCLQSEDSIFPVNGFYPVGIWLKHFKGLPVDFRGPQE